MGDDIETGRWSGSDYWAALLMLVERKSKQTDIDNRPEPMSSTINNSVDNRIYTLNIFFLMRKELLSK